MLFRSRGLAFSDLEDYKQAEISLKKLLEIDKENDLAYFYLGALYEKTGQKEKAEDFFRKVIKLNPQNPDAYNYLGYMFAEQEKNLDEAIELVSKALDIAPDNGAYVDSLGWAYYKKDMVDEALRYLEKAVELIPDDAVIRDHLGDAYYKKGDLDKAYQHWQRSLDLNPEQGSVKKKLEKNK